MLTGPITSQPFLHRGSAREIWRAPFAMTLGRPCHWSMSFFVVKASDQHIILLNLDVQVRDGLLTIAQAHHVNVRTGACVERITTANGTVTGVQLASGERIEAQLVITNR